ncbi:MAG: hypothetical protein E2O68_07265 [Deltaproteobacteria bacterium]|nr:MAG: hypothetical protein E2O68_07265 [Deltaproteobacteria bacterium]
MSSDFVNIDFEPELYKLESKTSFNKEFEYIYFFFEGKKLKNIRDYPKDYLEFLKHLGLEIPELSPRDLNPKDWWGELSEKSRVLNSKITALEIAQENGFCPTGVREVKNIEDIEKILKSNPDRDYFIRDPYLAAGNNSLILSLKNFNKKKLSNRLNERSLVMAPYFRRLMDLGFIFGQSEVEVLWNLNSKDGKFKGGIVYKDFNDLFNFIEKKWGFNRDVIWDAQHKIYDLYLKKGAEGLIQIDSFLYKEENQIKYYPLVEVNYRKSFGLFINRLRAFLSPGGVGIFLNFATKDLSPCENFAARLEQLTTLLYQNEKGVIPLSPQDGLFSSFFVSGETLAEINVMAQKIWDKISIGKRPFSPSLLLDQFIL